MSCHNSCDLLRVCFDAKCEAVQASKLGKRGEKFCKDLFEAQSFGLECSIVLKL